MELSIYSNATSAALMAPKQSVLPVPVPTSAHNAVRLLETKYEASVASGSVRPFLYPWDTLGAAVVILYLLIDHRRSWFLQQIRYPVWLFNVYFSIYTILYCRGQNPASAMGVGIISGWSILWTSNLIFSDCQANYARIERRRDLLGKARFQTNGSTKISGTDHTEEVSEETNSIPHLTSAGSSELRLRGGQPNGQLAQKKLQDSTDEVYFWQSYPVSSFKDRLDWVLDVFTTFRGTSWNWRVSNIPPPPAHIQASLLTSPAPPSQPGKPSRTTMRTLPDRRAVLRHNLYIVVRNCLILDATKAFTSHDPYFWGQTETTVPPPYMPASLQHSFPAIRIARLLLCLSLMRGALELIFALGPLFFLSLPERLVGVRQEAWLHPDQFGSFGSVFTKGLAGWWGAFWHQTFRKGFEAPGDLLVSTVGLEPRGMKAKAVKLFVAFGLSGALHAGGSLTQLGETDPMLGPLAFFLSQAVGIVVQMVWQGELKRRGLADKVPAWIGYVGNFLFVMIWLYFTGPLMMDDFAKGGVWLFEPVPISLSRGPLGLGSKEDGFWRWTGRIMSWHRGDTWWQTGLAL